MQRKRRQRGSGSIFRRGDVIVWQRTIGGKTKTTTLRDADGTPIKDKRIARGVVNRLLLQEMESVREAESLHSKAEVISRLATIKGLLDRCTVKVSDLETAWLSSPKRTESNATARLTAIRHFTQWLCRNNPNCEVVADVTNDMALSYMACYWRSGISARAYNVRLNQLQIVFRAFRPDDNPFSGIAKKRESSESRHAFTKAQLQAIWLKLEDEAYYMLHKGEMIAVYVLALYSGLRCGDCCLLRWQDVDLANAVLTVKPSKTRHSNGKAVIIPIAQPLHDALISMLPYRDDTDYVFPRVAKRYLRNADGIYKDTTALLEASGIATKIDTEGQRQRKAVKYSFHSFRHTTATMLAEKGISPLVIKEVMGHSTVDMTAHYSHVGLAAKRKALAALAVNQPKQIELALADLNSVKMDVLLSWLDNNLSDAQKSDLRAVLA